MKKMNTLNGLQGFLRLWASQTVSALGTAMTEYALVIWVYGQRGTASSVTLLTLCTFLPTILFRFAGGLEVCPEMLFERRHVFVGYLAVRILFYTGTL